MSHAGGSSKLGYTAPLRVLDARSLGRGAFGPGRGDLPAWLVAAPPPAATAL